MAELATKKYDITGCPMCLCSCCCCKTELELTPSGAVLNEYGMSSCCKASTLRPYREISKVEQIRWCCCWVGFKAKIKEKETFWPGCGCQSSKVEDVVSELAARMTKFGATETGTEEPAPVEAPEKPMEMEART